MSNMLNYRGDRDIAANATGVIAGFMNGVYAWMCAGLGLTGVVAMLTARNTDFFDSLLPWMLPLVLVELGLVVAISWAVNRIGPAVATAMFMLYAAINGLTLSVLFMYYTQASIAGAFMITAGMFGAMSVYGMTTKRDLSGMGSMMFMALVGLLIASLVNIFMQNQMLYWLISYAGVAIFVGLTAWDTQKLKYIALQTAGDPRMAARMAIVGSLMLYLDFVNLLIFILRIMGKRK